MRISSVSLALAFVLLGAIPAELYGQVPSTPTVPTARTGQGAGRALFGNSIGRTESLLALTTFLGAGIDNNILAAATNGTIAPGFASSAGVTSSFAQGGAGLIYSAARGNFGWGAGGGAGATYYPVLGSLVARNRFVSGNGSYSRQVTRRAQFTAQVSGAYQPLQTLLQKPSFVPSSGPDVPPTVQDQAPGLVVENQFLGLAAVGLTDAFSRHGKLTLNYTGSQTRSPSHDLDQGTHTGRAGVSYGLAKGLGLRFGYGYTTARYRTGNEFLPSRRQDIDAGIDFSRSLSFSRKTTFSFSTGSSLLSSGNQQQFIFTGNALLTHMMLRTWTAGLAYDRGVQFVDTLHEPVLSDGASATLGGSFSRRVGFRSSVGTGLGNVGLGGGENSFATVTGNANLTMSLRQNLDLAVDYTYYRHRFGRDVDLPEGLSPRTDRQTLRAYVTLWTPLFQRKRKP